MTFAYATFTLGSILLYSAFTGKSVIDIIMGTGEPGTVSDQPLTAGDSASSSSGTTSSNHVSIGNQTGSSMYKGVEICNWIIAIIKQAEKDVGPLQPTSGVRKGFDPHTATGQTEHSGCSGKGGPGSGAVDFGGYGGSPDADKFRKWLATHGNPMRGGESYGDRGHFSKDGH